VLLLTSGLVSAQFECFTVDTDGSISSFNVDVNVTDITADEGNQPFEFVVEVLLNTEATCTLDLLNNFKIGYVAGYRDTRTNFGATY